MIRAIIFDCFGVLVGESLDVNQSLFAYIRSLKKRYKLSMVSNISSRERLSEVLSATHIELFDELVLSGEVGVAKPDERIYQLATGRMGVLPEECVFVDDSERSCHVARAMGMQAIQFEDTAQCMRAIEDMISRNMV